MTPSSMTSISNTIICLESVSLSYRQRRLFGRGKLHQVLDDVNLDVRAGETLGIIGRNGAGKSSLLKLLAGIISPDRGCVRRGKQRVILLSYQLGFNGQLTGRENAIYSALLQGVSQKDIEVKMQEIVAFSGLEEAIDDQLSTYSSGMKARLGFAVAIQSDADVILVDEALGVGDHAFREKSVAFMKQWIRSNKTVVFVSHDENSVKGLCDRVVWLEGGRVVAQGESQEVFASYHQYDYIVESFAKKLNMTPAQVREHESNRNPLEVVERVREFVKDLWNKEDQWARGSDKTVRYCRPKSGSIPSQLVHEECGNCVWVENTLEICKGRNEEVQATYDQFTRLVNNMAEGVKLSYQSYCQSHYYKELVGLFREIKRVGH